jgi:hypothetical protein
MSFVSNGGKFKLYTVPDGLFFSTPTQPRFPFELMIEVAKKVLRMCFVIVDLITNKQLSV